MTGMVVNMSNVNDRNINVAWVAYIGLVVFYARR
jgi:hypothetical protein